VPWSTTREGIAVILVAATAVAAVLMRVTVLGHVPFLPAVAVLGACFVFGGAYVRRGQGLAVLVLLGVLTLWVVADRNDPAPRDPSPRGHGVVVALGDSYASGEGDEAFFAGTDLQGGNQCRRSSDAYGYQVARAFRRHLDFYACSGALAEEVWKRAQVPVDATGDGVGKLPQLANPVKGTPDLVLISIGGNDALFGAVGRGCALPGSCVDIKQLFDGNLDHVRSVVTTALTEVSARFPDSPVLVVPYPQMLPTPPPPGVERRRGDCDGVPLGTAELDYLHGYVADLDAQVEQAVVAANGVPGAARNIAYFAAGEDAYLGYRICGPGKGDSAVNTLAFAPTDATHLFDRLVPTSWTHNSFHPKRLGHDLLRDALVPWIRAHVPGFGDATAFPATLRARAEAAPDRPRTCETRDECTAVVNAWSTGRTIEALRAAFPYALLLGAAGWLLAAVRRLPVRRPRPRRPT
jgi:lysophospholipase L1-like esterase